MRVDHETRSAGGDTLRVAPRTFVAALRARLRPAGATAARRALPPGAARTPTVVSVAAQLRSARARMDASVKALVESAAGAIATGEARCARRAEDAGRAGSDRLPPSVPGPHDPRVGDREVPGAPERGGQPPGAVPGVTAAPAPAGAGELASPPAQVEAALALVERVETFLRSGRPGLAFHLGGGAGQSVELERVGPRRVSVSLRGGALGPADARRLRSELGARGITLARLDMHARRGPAGAG